MPRDRRVDVVGVEPLHRLGRPGDGRRRLAELDRQRLDDLDLGLGEPGEHRRQLGHRLSGRPACRTPSLRLAGVVELELELLGDDLFGHRRPEPVGAGAARAASGSAVLLALQEIERHGGLPGRASGWDAPVIVAAARVARPQPTPRGRRASSGRERQRPRVSVRCWRVEVRAARAVRQPPAAARRRRLARGASAKFRTTTRRSAARLARSRRGRPIVDGVRRAAARRSGAAGVVAAQRDQPAVRREHRPRIVGLRRRRCAVARRRRTAATAGRS